MIPYAEINEKLARRPTMARQLNESFRFPKRQQAAKPINQNHQQKRRKSKKGNCPGDTARSVITAAKETTYPPSPPTQRWPIDPWSIPQRVDGLEAGQFVRRVLVPTFPGLRARTGNHRCAILAACLVLCLAVGWFV